MKNEISGPWGGTAFEGEYHRLHDEIDRLKLERETCNGSCDIALARRQVGPDAIVPGNARECAEAWEQEAARLHAEVEAMEQSVERHRMWLTQKSNEKVEALWEMADLRGSLAQIAALCADRVVTLGQVEHIARRALSAGRDDARAAMRTAISDLEIIRVDLLGDAAQATRVQRVMDRLRVALATARATKGGA